MGAVHGSTYMCLPSSSGTEENVFHSLIKCYLLLPGKDVDVPTCVGRSYSVNDSGHQFRSVTAMTCLEVSVLCLSHVFLPLSFSYGARQAVG